MASAHRRTPCGNIGQDNRGFLAPWLFHALLQKRTSAKACRRHSRVDECGRGRSLSLPQTVAASGNGFILPVAGTKGNRAGRRARRGFLDATLKRPGHSVPAGNISPSYVKRDPRPARAELPPVAETRQAEARRAERAALDPKLSAIATLPTTDFGSRADNKAGHRDVGSSKACGNRNRLRICSRRSLRSFR